VADNDLIEFGNVLFVPCLHGRVEFASAVHRLFAERRPEAVAIEMPATLEHAFLRGVKRLPRLSVVLYEEQSGGHVYLPIEPQDAVVAAAALALEHNLPLHFIDRDTEGYPPHRDPMPDPYLVTRLGLAAYAEAYRLEFEDRPSARADELREMTMAFHLKALAEQHASVLCVLGLTHYGPVRRLLDRPLAQPLGKKRREGVVLGGLAQESAREILSEMPFLISAFVQAAQEGRAGELDRLAVHQALLGEARERHLKNSREEVRPGQMAVLNRFGRNYALVQGGLTPDLYQLLIAGRGAVDDNFAYEVWDLATSYPWPGESDDLPTVRLTAEDLFLNEKKIRFFRRFRRQRRRLVPVPVKKRKKEEVPGQWQREWQGMNICSYPPEDIIIEGYGQYIKQKAVQMLSEENRRTHPFTCSMEDGLDIRETIRNWYEGRMYVTECRPAGGRVGSVVVIFDEDRPLPRRKEKYPWRLTWLGEHAQESDMAFYATRAGEQVIGPGISRCEYGGLMLSYPPLRMADIWTDSFFDGARNKAERLLMAAIDYSEEKLVAYIGPRPPSSRMKSLAEMYGRKVVFLPLGQFSPLMLKKIRVFHVLDGHQVRGYAREYIY